MIILEVVSFTAAVVVLPMVLYLGLLALVARARGAPLAGRGQLRFAVVVPAHNEATGITATVRSLESVAYPKALFDVYVVAHNCTDATADLASAAGAIVWPFFDTAERSKGRALDFAFGRILRETEADAVVVIDADTLVSPNLLSACEARLLAGLDAVQVDYAVRNIEASWRTRLMAVALSMFHRTRSLARERLGLSCGLRGNGMCFSRTLLRQVPHVACSLVEDVEYGVYIGLHGSRVAYAPEAVVRGEMAVDGRSAASQRRRWEGGRRQLVRRLVPQLLRAAKARRSPMLLDLAFDLLLPPLSTLVLATMAGLTFELVAFSSAGSPSLALWLWSSAALGLILYAVRGVQYAGLGLGGFLSLAWAPAYILWKLTLALRPAAPGEWVRTRRAAERESRTPPPPS